MTGDVLLTGGAGFIGGHLAERLDADGHRVRVLDRREPLTAPMSDWVEGDVRDAAAIERAAAGASMIIHLASVVGVDALLADPVEAIDVAVNGTMRVLEAAGRADVPVVHLSTSEVLGINPDVPWAEGADRVLGSSLADRWSYGTAKATAEHLVLAWSRSRRLPATIVRPFNVYGPRQEPRFVVASMVDAAISGGPIVVDGDGSQTRCFSYVDDVVEGLVRVAAAPGRVPILHLGSEDERSVLELAKLVRDAVGGDAAVTFRSTGDRWGAMEPDIARRIPDTSLAQAVFGWRATTSLSEGLRRVVDWATTTRRDDPLSTVTPGA